MKIIKEKILQLEKILGIYNTGITPDVIFTDKILTLCEEKDYLTKIPGLKGYRYRKDKPNGIPAPGNQYHWHIYHYGQECFAVNIDVTGHDGHHNVTINDEVANFLREKGANIPMTNIIECRDIQSKQLLND